MFVVEIVWSAAKQSSLLKLCGCSEVEFALEIVLSIEK